jgi:hypothetical protein
VKSRGKHIYIILWRNQCLSYVNVKPFYKKCVLQIGLLPNVAA